MTQSYSNLNLLCYELFEVTHRIKVFEIYFLMLNFLYSVACKLVESWSAKTKEINQEALHGYARVLGLVAMELLKVFLNLGKNFRTFWEWCLTLK